MFDTRLSQTVEGFASQVLPLSEKAPEREWIWRDHIVKIDDAVARTTASSISTQARGLESIREQD